MPAYSPFMHEDDADYLGFDILGAGMKRRGPRTANVKGQIHEERLVPRLDLVDDKDGKMTTALIELPGVDKSHIEINIHNNKLHVSGKIAPWPEMQGSDVSIRVAERTFGPFQKTINVGPNVKASDVKASYQHGILRLEFPKNKEGAATSVKVM